MASPSPSSSVPASRATTPQSTPSSSQPSIPRPIALETSVTQRSVRGSSFTTREDEALVKAWIRVSEDPIVGADQKGDIFYKAIAEVYGTLQPPSCPKRNSKSVERRVKKILSDTLSFSGCVAKVSKSQPSGTNSSDVIHLATALYNKYEISSITEDCGPTFKFLSCWEQLKDHPKFDLLLNPPEPASEIDNRDDVELCTTTNDENNELVPFQRPMGRKRAKLEDSKSELSVKKVKLAEATLEAQKERNELMKSQQEMSLFTCKYDETDPIAKEYITTLRLRALKRLKETESAPPST